MPATLFISIIAATLGVTVIYLLYLFKEKNKVVSEVRSQLESTSKKAAALEETNKTKDKLLAILSHDLRSPVRNLRSVISLAADNSINQEQFQRLSSSLSTEMERSETMLENVLTWMNSQKDGIVARKHKVNLRLMAYEIKMLLLEAANSKNIKVLCECPGEILVSVDRDQLHIILRNLLNNAIKFTPVDSLIVIAATTGGDYARIDIIDQGKGMDRAAIDKFMAGEKINTTLGTKNEKGTGFGLLICKELINQNGGKMHITSEPGVGTTFSVALQLAHAHADSVNAMQ